MSESNLRQDAHLVVSVAVETALVLHPELQQFVSDQSPDHYFDDKRQAGNFRRTYHRLEPRRAEALDDFVIYAIKEWAPDL